MNDDSSARPAPTWELAYQLTYQVLAVWLSLFVLVAVNTNLFDRQPNLALFGLLGLVLVFLSQPPLPRWKNSWPVRVIDLLLVAATVVVFGYVFVQSERMLEAFWVDGTLLGNRAGQEKPLDFWLAGIGLVLVLEGTRRAIGWTLPILCACFIAYALYGPSLPDWLFPHRGSSWQQIAQKTFLQEGGVFGIALYVMFMYVFLFVLFGTLLEQTGATGYVIRLARGLFKSSSGGPAKVAVLSSGLMGSLSGSAVANTATTGTFTIPLMKSAGFKANTAGGIEAAASSGGALMPPIMGAGAYMMLELVDPPVTYVQIIQAALIPAILYYTALLLTVHFHAQKVGAGSESDLRKDKEETLDEGRDTFDASQGIVFFGSFVILIAMLVKGFTPFRAVSVSLIGILALSMFSRHTRLGPGRILQALVGAARGGVALIVAASCVGIILGVVDLTGLGAALPAKIQAFAGDNAIMALLLLMVSTIVLGMGLPSAVCYLLMAILVGSVLKTLNTPPLAAHLFIFYFGMMSMVTPPVALAAYAAAAISKGNVMGTALAAFRFSLVGFALPFAFVLKPELLMLTAENEPAGWLAIVEAVAIVGVATVGLSAAIAGFAGSRLNWLTRGVWFGLSLLIFFTRDSGFQWWLQVGAAAILLVWLVIQLRWVAAQKNARRQQPAGESVSISQGDGSQADR